MAIMHKHYNNTEDRQQEVNLNAASEKNYLFQQNNKVEWEIQ